MNNDFDIALGHVVQADTQPAAKGGAADPRTMLLGMLQAMADPRAAADMAMFLGSGRIPLTVTGGVPDHPVAQVAAGIPLPEDGHFVSIVPASTNTGPVTLTIGASGAALPVKDAQGRKLARGDFRAGRRHLLRRHGDVWRIVSDDAGQRGVIPVPLPPVVDHPMPEFVDPDNQGDAWHSIRTTDAGGPVIRYLSRQWRETWGFEKRGDVTLAQTPDPALAFVAFGGGSAGVVRSLADDFRFHAVDETLVSREDRRAAHALAASYLEDEFAHRRGLSTVVTLTEPLSSTVESDALPGSPARAAIVARVAAARSALGPWGKDLQTTALWLSLLEGAPRTPQATADLHYAAVANGMRQEIAEAAGSPVRPYVLVTQSAGSRVDGTSPVILAEGNLDWAHWSLGFVVVGPRYPYALQAGSPATLTPDAALLLSELCAIALTERMAGRDWYGPSMGAQARIDGAVITVPFTAMTDLVLRDPANHGFAVDGLRNGATIQSVTVAGKTATITLTAAPEVWTLLADPACGDGVSVSDLSASGMSLQGLAGSGARHVSWPVRFPAGTRIRFSVATSGGFAVIQTNGPDQGGRGNHPMTPAGGLPAGTQSVDVTVSDEYDHFGFVVADTDTARITNFRADLPPHDLTVRLAYGETGDRRDGRPANRSSLTDGWSQPSRLVPGASHHRYARSARASVTR